MRSHEARPSSVPPKLNFFGRGQSTLLSPSQNLGGDSSTLSPLPRDLRHCIQVEVNLHLDQAVPGGWS